MAKYYVTATDKFLSGWGLAKGRISKFVLECDTYEEACFVEDKVSQRSDMKFVNICSKRPRYSSTRYHVSYVTRTEAPSYYPV